MAGRTNSEKIDSLQAAVTRLEADLENLEEKSSEQFASIHEQIDRLKEAESDTRREIAVLQQRCSTLEKHSDQRWQLWLGVVAGLISLVVSLAVAIVKR